MAGRKRKLEENAGSWDSDGLDDIFAFTEIAEAGPSSKKVQLSAISGHGEHSGTEFPADGLNNEKIDYEVFEKYVQGQLLFRSLIFFHILAVISHQVL